MVTRDVVEPGWNENLLFAIAYCYFRINGKICEDLKFEKLKVLKVPQITIITWLRRCRSCWGRPSSSHCPRGCLAVGDRPWGSWLWWWWWQTAFEQEMVVVQRCQLWWDLCQRPSWGKPAIYEGHPFKNDFFSVVVVRQSREKGHFFSGWSPSWYNRAESRQAFL